MDDTYHGATTMFPAPDMSVIAAGRRAAPPWPDDLLPGPLQELATAIADGTAAPVDYVGIAMLSAAATAIGGSRKVRAYAGHSWTEPAILWVGAVGDPSSGKSPAIEAIVEPLRQLEQEFASDFALTLRNYQADTEAAKLDHAAWLKDLKDAKEKGWALPPLSPGAVPPLKPNRPRLVVQDSTPEAIAGVLVSNRRLMSYRDELAGWFQSFERYAPGGRAQWLEAFGGRPFVIDRKGAEEPVVIPFNGVSVLGGIQPDRLNTVVLSGDDDGLAARFCWAWPEPVPYHRPKIVADTAIWPRCLGKLVKLFYAHDADMKEVAVAIPLEEEASAIFATWRTNNPASAAEGGPLYKSHVGKMPGIILRVALVLEYLDWTTTPGAPEPDTVNTVSILRAIRFCDEYLLPMARRVFGDASLPDVDRDTAALARWIIREKPAKINLSDVRRNVRLPNLGTAEPLQAAASQLVEADWLFSAGKRAGETAGAVSKDYVVNPRVYPAAEREVGL